VNALSMRDGAYLIVVRYWGRGAVIETRLFHRKKFAVSFVETLRRRNVKYTISNSIEGPEWREWEPLESRLE
jgi:hypothetical protein